MVGIGSRGPGHCTFDSQLKIRLYYSRMRYEIVLSPEAAQDLKRLGAHKRAKVKRMMEVHLRNEPAKTSRNRIKRLRGLSQPQYRLMADDIRVFYDVGKTRWRYWR